MKATYPEALRRVLVHEGGFSDHRKDPGGVTGHGITQRVYDSFRREQGKPTRPITPALIKTAEWMQERDTIYKRQYWDAAKCDQLPKGVDYVVFDGTVNSGVSQSVKWLQRSLDVKADGVVGMNTLDAMERCKNHDALIAEICQRRMAFLKELKTWNTFGKGWTSRVQDVLKAGQAWATGLLPPKPVTAPLGEAKAEPEDIAEAPVGNGTTATTTTGGFVLAEALDKLQEVISTLTPFSDGIKVVKYGVIALSLVSAGLLLYGIYRSYKAQRARNGEDRAVVEPA